MTEHGILGRRKIPAAVALVLTGLTTLSAGCTTASPATAPPDLTPFTEQELSFVPCDEAIAVEGAPAAECATLEVPLDYDDPRGARIRVGISRVPATGGDPIGSVVVNPGGPGASALGFAPAVAAAWGDGPARKRFDVVAMDPRGVGVSEPAIDCYTDSQREGDAIVSGIPAGALAWTSDSARAVLDRCAASVGGMQVLERMGTRDVARDLDVLRAVLGDARLTFLGASYGTRLGAVYAEMFPDRVRALVLDGAIDPRKDVLERQIQLFSGVQRSFEELAAQCAAQGDCPLGDDPTRASEVAQSLLQPLVEQPLPISSGRKLTFFTAIEGIVLGLYSQEAWPAVIAGFADLRAGGGDVLLALRDASSGRMPDGTYSDSSEATLAINCLDEIQPAPDEVTANVARVNEVAPFLDPGVKIDTRYGCEGWPIEATLDFPYATDIPGLPTSLVVSVSGDGLTPHEGGIALAEAMDASLLTVDGEQHGATTSGDRCVNRAVEDYLVTLETPADGLRCTLEPAGGAAPAR